LLNRNAQYQEWLLPYLEGGLDGARRAQLEARLAADPALAAEAERLRRTLGGLRALAARTPPPENAQVPTDLWPHLRARLVLDPAPRPRARLWWVAGAAAPAAAALILAAFWLPGWHTPDMAPLAQRPTARPAAVSPAPTAPVRPLHTVGGQPRPAPDVEVSAAKVSEAKPAMAAPRPAPVAHIAARTNPFTLPVPVAPPPTVSVANGPVGLSNGPAPGASPITQAPRRSSGFAPPAPVLPAKVAPPPPPAAPKPMLPTPEPAPVAAATGADEEAPATRAAPNVTVNGLEGAARPQPRPAAPSPMAMHAPSVQALRDPRRSKIAQHYANPAVVGSIGKAFALDGAASLDAEQAALSAAVQPPLWGENAGEQQANQALMAVRETGLLDDLRARLEARRAQSPQSLVTARMLAAVYSFGFSSESALRERRRIAGLEGATGEDWFVLAQAEEGARNTAAARAAYRHALESPVPPSGYHAAIARGK